jgi:SRSO17 transposase
VNEGLPGKEVWLIIRKDEGESKVKYQLCNAGEDTSIEKLGKTSCSRYWMERAIEDGKGLVGLGDYEVRGWRGWHHHMTMSLLAMLFLLELQIEWRNKAPQLTVQDVREILEVMLPKKEVTPEDILKIIQQKHKARDSARKFHH